MAVEIPNKISAMGSVLEDGTEIAAAGGTVTRTGLGVYRLILEQPLAPNEYTAAICPKGGDRRVFSITDVSNAEKTITFPGFNIDEDPFDSDFTWMIFQLPGT